MNKFIVHFQNNPEFIGLYQTDESLETVYFELQDGWYNINLTQLDDQTPIFYSGYISSPHLKYRNRFNERFELIEELSEYNKLSPPENEVLSFDRIELNDKKLEEFKLFLKNEFPEVKIYQESEAMYTGAEDAFSNLIIGIASGLMASGIFEIIKFLVYKKASTRDINQIIPANYLDYLQKNFNLNPNDVNLTSAIENEQKNLEFVFENRNTIYRLTIDQTGKVIEANTSKKNQTGI